MMNKKGETGYKWRSGLSPLKALINYTKKEEITHRKLQKIIRAYIKERIEQQEHLNIEVAGLNKRLKENSIDEDTHARLNNMLEIVYEQKRQETIEKYGFTKNANADTATK